MQPSAVKIVKLFALVVVGLVVLIVGLRLMGFELSTYSPDRPPNIPEDTVWAGGADGGVWIRCLEIAGSDPQKFTCDVFGENGSTWLSQGTFQPFKVWDRTSNNATHEAAYLTHLEYNGWDGRWILLRDGYALKLLD